MRARRRCRARSSRARFGARIVLRDALPPIAHGFTHFALTLHPQRADRQRIGPRVPKPRAPCGSRPEDAQGAALPAPIRKLLRGL